MRVAQAEALQALERREDAVNAAHRALQLASSAKKREELVEHIRSIGIAVNGCTG